VRTQHTRAKDFAVPGIGSPRLMSWYRPGCLIFVQRLGRSVHPVVTSSSAPESNVIHRRGSIAESRASVAVALIEILNAEFLVMLTSMTFPLDH